MASLVAPPTNRGFLEFLIEERQLAHVSALDAAYVDQLTALRAAAGQDVAQSNLLADSYVPYRALRQHLLRERLEAARRTRRAAAAAAAAAGGAAPPPGAAYPLGNAFLLPACRGLDAPAATSAVTEASPAAPHLALSFMAWRRALLDRRFERRRAALEGERIRRKAAENVQRAMEAEAAARDEFDEIREEREQARRRAALHAAAEVAAKARSGGANGGADGKAEAAAEAAAAATAAASAALGGLSSAASAGGDFVWRARHCLSTFDEVSDPALVQAMAALGIATGQRLPPAAQAAQAAALERAAIASGAASASTSPSSAAAAGLAGAQQRLQQQRRRRGRASGPPPPLAYALFGAAAERIGARSVTSVSFLSSSVPPTGVGVGADAEAADTFAIGTDTGAISLCSAAHGVSWATLTGHEGAVTALDWAVGEGFLFLVSASTDGTARVWLVTLPTFELPPPPASPQRERGRARAREKERERETERGSASLPPEPSHGRLGAPPLPGSGVGPLRGRSRDAAAADASVARRAERDRARRAMEAEDARAREDQQRARGPQAKGGEAACVQVVRCEFPLTGARFLPLSPSLFVVTAVESADLFAMEELGLRTRNALASAAAEQRRSVQLQRAQQAQAQADQATAALQMQEGLAIASASASASVLASAAASATALTQDGQDQEQLEAQQRAVDEAEAATAAEAEDSSSGAGDDAADAGPGAEADGGDEASGLDAAGDGYQGYGAEAVAAVSPAAAAGVGTGTGTAGSGAGLHWSRVGQAFRKGGGALGGALKKGLDWTEGAALGAMSRLDQAVVKLDQALAKSAAAAVAGGGMVVGGLGQGLGLGGGGASSGGGASGPAGGAPGSRALAAAAAFQQRLAHVRQHARGYVLVLDAVSGRVLQTRLVQGVQVSPVTLARPASFPTALAFAPDGATLFVADARGLVHSYEVETDEARLAGASEAAQAGTSGGPPPLKEHAVLFGESSALVSGLRRLGDQVAKAAADGAAGLEGLGAGVASGAGAGAGTSSSAAATATAASGDDDGPTLPYFTQLFCKRDQALGGAPVLIGLDSAHRVRALTVPAAGMAARLTSGLDQMQAEAGDDVARAALAAVGFTTKATALLLRAGVGVATLGALQVNMQAQSAELEHYIKYNASYNTALGQGGGGGGAGGVAAHSAAASLLAGSGHGGGGTVTGQAHLVIAPVEGRDALACANACGEVFILRPHGGDGDPGGVGGSGGVSAQGHGGSAGGGLSGLARRQRLASAAAGGVGVRRGKGAALALQAASQAALGSGVAERQVDFKLSLAQALSAGTVAAAQAAAGDVNAPVAALGVSRSERFIVVAQANDSGQVVIWERINADEAAREDEARAAEEERKRAPR